MRDVLFATIQFQESKKPQAMNRISIPKGQHIRVTLTSNECGKNHWTARAF